MDTLRRLRHRPASGPSGDPAGPSVAVMPWLQPYPDVLLDELVSDQPDPEARALFRESISLAYLAVIQLLPARQRAVLILRDVLDWPANEVAPLIDSSVPAVKSALQRARATLRKYQVNLVPPPPPPDADQRRLLQAYIAAHEQANPEALIAVLREDVRLAISPQVGEFIGRAQVAAALRAGMTSRGAWRVLATAANGRLAAAGYLCQPGETAFLPFAISVLDIQDGQLADIAAFEGADLFAAFGLPASL